MLEKKWLSTVGSFPRRHTAQDKQKLVMFVTDTKRLSGGTIIRLMVLSDPLETKVVDILEMKQRTSLKKSVSLVNQLHS